MKSKKLWLVMGLMLLILFSFSALATAVSTPGSALSTIYEFFKGLVTGGADIDDAYFITFVLYFIIFLTIFMEGMRFIPIFGSKGEVNKQGKVFAVAASALATMALFIVEQGTNVSSVDRLNYLIAPFGIWGGVAIAGLVAYITFRLLHNSDLFKEQIVLAMALAAAVGVTFAGFLLSLDNLIGWGFLIMIIVFIVGAIRAFTLTGKERKKTKEEKRKGEIDRFKKADEEKEEKRKQKKIKALVSPVVKDVKDTMKIVDKTISHLDNDQVKKFKSTVKDLDKKLNDAIGNLSSLRTKFKGTQFDEVKDLIIEIGATRDKFRDEVVKKIPARGRISVWGGTVEKDLRDELNNLNASVGVIWNKLKKFHKKK